MKNCLFLILIVMVVSTGCDRDKRLDTITIDIAARGIDVPESLYGIFFEEINHAGDGGLYAELIQNRHFEDSEIPEGYMVDNSGDLRVPPVPNDLTGRTFDEPLPWHNEKHPAWSLITGKGTRASMSLTKDNPLIPQAPNSMEIVILTPGEGVVLQNTGFWGVPVKKDENYKLRFYMCPDRDIDSVKVRIVSEKEVVLAENRIDNIKPGWNEYKAVMTARETDYNAKFELVFDVSGKIQVDYVSLFPEKTFKRRENGLREDIAQILADLKPAFIRWPGGCVVEGATVSNRVQWKKTIGDPVTRPGEYCVWGYRNSYGFGYDEFLRFCEDIGADGMFVCNVGMGCQSREGDICTDEELPMFLQDALDAIEYAIGDTTTLWGARRAGNGHPDPYPLKYFEVGNEQWGPVYHKRFDIFYKAIKERYPEMIVIATDVTRDVARHIEKTDMTDPHNYSTVNDLFKNIGWLDTAAREDHKIYLGEYAANNGPGAGTMIGALSEAAFITGLERNSDLLTMSSYAPLLENRNDVTWPVNLIWFDNEKVVPRSSYYVQKMYSLNKPTYNLKTDIDLLASTKFPQGRIGFGTWNTRAEFKDIKITNLRDKIYTSGQADWDFGRGKWIYEEGILRQISDQANTMGLLEKPIPSIKYTIEAKVRKISGNEGFFIYFGMSEDGMDGYRFNVGGWGNTSTTLEAVRNGELSSMQTQIPYSIETDRWYDVKLIVDEYSAELVMDGTSVVKYGVPPGGKRFYAVSGYDEKSGEVILKVVNAEKDFFRIRIDLKNAGYVEEEAKVTVLEANSFEDENSLDKPHKINPIEIPRWGVSSVFDYVFTPRSFTILRIKTTKK